MTATKERVTATRSIDETDAEESNIRQFVTFVACEEVFAIDMAPVREIIRLPDVVRVPLAPATLDGLANLRGRVLPIVSLRRLLGFPDHAHDEATRAIVVDIDQPIGFVVDRVATVIGVDPAQIEAIGAMSSTIDTALLSGIIKDVGGHAMIMVLDISKLIDAEFSEIAGSGAPSTGSRTTARHAETDADADSDVGDELQLVSFEVDGQEYAFAIGEVQEIVQVPEAIVHMPRSLAHLVGVTTLRGRLMPVVDLRVIFGLTHRPLDDSSRIIVVSAAGATIGVAVDAVNEVLRVARADVGTVPALFGTAGKLSDITALCQLDGGKRLVSVVAAESLFELLPVPWTPS
ncbi:chemotaxis protein CheW [Sphingomonas psychrolutea]|uniref:CheW-like domain-containing protein n=1 Tax=Sphingomonas psychrolutea TaxID=1259676 RepID=A0ABQ1G3W7_9SPHN|nr:chemotaxis protein CheW [Sphingomonas psychrolutea]GGA36153.1 hypothetical protein GCM10011395_03060 [Sphingomonas psychrolutea]